MYERILRHLQEYGSITSYEAIKEYGCTRLSQYIYLLRKNGYIVESVTESSLNHYGEKTHYSRYKLIGEVEK